MIQSTPYIGHPAYKAMGARSAYTLATALFVGAAGIFGYFDWIFFIIPKAVIFPILIFIGLEITSQSFHATPARHYPAVALACVPALAYLAVLALNQLMPDLQAVRRAPAADPALDSDRHGPGRRRRLHRHQPACGATALAHLIDGRVRPVVATLLLAAVFSWFGIIHSPLPSSPIMTPGAVIRQLEAEGRAEAAARQTPYHWSAGLCADGRRARGPGPLRHLAGRRRNGGTRIR